MRAGVISLRALFFVVLNQDVQDFQDFQDGGRSGMRRKGLEDLNVYSPSAQQGVKVLKDLNLSSLQLRVFLLLRSSRTLTTHPTGFL